MFPLFTLHVHVICDYEQNHFEYCRPISPVLNKLKLFCSLPCRGTKGFLEVGSIHADPGLPDPFVPALTLHSRFLWQTYFYPRRRGRNSGEGDNKEHMHVHVYTFTVMTDYNNFFSGFCNLICFPI